MNSPVLVGIGLGLASALLFASTASGSAFGLLLSYVSPLPVMIAALGWTHLAGLLAFAIAGAALSVALPSTVAIAYAVGIGLPAWSLAWAAGLTRPDPKTAAPLHVSPGILLGMIPAVASAIVMVGAISLARSYEQYSTIVGGAIETMLRLQTRTPEGQPLQLPGAADPAEIVQMVANLLPFVAGASFTMLFAINLWGAGKAVHVSGRLPRPWEPMWSLQLPVGIVGLAGFGLLLSLVGGFPGLYGQALTGGVVAALVFQGLAALHRITLGKPVRPLALGMTYTALLIAQIWVAPVLAIYGLYHVFRPSGPPPGPGTPPAQIS